MGFILSLESSTEICSVAISREGHVLSERTILRGHSHSKELTTLISACMKSANIGFKDLNAVALSGGPGSYTGLRVGTSTAKGICYALNIPLIAVSTLMSLASRHISKDGYLIMPMMDARRMEVYTSVFDSHLNALIETTNLIISPESMSDIVNRYSPLLICGNGAAKCKPFVEDFTSVRCIADSCDAASMCSLAYEKFKQKNFENTAYYSPFYFKAPNITKSKKDYLA